MNLKGQNFQNLSKIQKKIRNLADQQNFPWVKIIPGQFDYWQKRRQIQSRYPVAAKILKTIAEPQDNWSKWSIW